MTPTARFKAFAYVAAERAPLYRAIMRIFMESKERFVFDLRPHEVLNSVRGFGLRESFDLAEIDSALAQLCEWGNLQTRPDTSDVGTVEDFYRQRYAVRITDQGEAAERALESFRDSSSRKGELQTASLSEIRNLLRELKELAASSAPDVIRVNRAVLLLRARFEEMANRAQNFMAGLEGKSEIQAYDTERFASYAQRLVAYVERFVSELVFSSEDVAQAVRDLEASGLEQLIRAAAGCSVAGVIEPAPDDLQSATSEWLAWWNRFRDWFVSRAHRVSNADVLRARARSSITSLLSVVASINDRRISRIDRSNDFRVLARWFMEAESDADAHRLWRGMFGLSPARHLVVNEATLDDYEGQDVPAATSWLDAPPLRISLRLRTHPSSPRSGRLSRIIDRSAEKEKLAAVSHLEALRILAAQARFSAGGRMRLSEIGPLESGEFDLFLDLIGEAVSSDLLAGAAREILSADGSLGVRLEPTDDGRTAFIQTPEGVLSGPDYWITIEAVSPEGVTR